MGGGKTLVKSRTYVCLLTIIFAISFVALSQNLVIAAPKRRAASSKRAATTSSKRSKTSSTSNKSKAKRAAVGGVSAKRAAVSGATSRRAATSSRRRSATGTRRRVMSRGGVKSSAVVVDNVESKEEVKGGMEECPVEKVIVGKFDEEGNFKYYSGNEECSKPGNAEAYKWDISLKSKYPRGSIKESEAYYFGCEENYVVRSEEGKRVCGSIFKSCPLGVVLERGEGGYLSPETGEVCELPANSKARLVGEGENNRGDVDDSSAYIAECNANKYSAPINDSESDLHLQCLSCPKGYISPVGADSKDKCIEDCKEGKVAGDNGKCVSCDANATYSDKSCICKDGYYGKGYGDKGCQPCPAGNICVKGEKKEVNKANNEYVNNTGASQAKICPDGAKSTGTSCTCNDGNYTFDVNSNTCVVSKCAAGKILEGGKCVDCPAGYYCSGDNNKTACNAGTYNASTGATSSASCVKCQDYHWSDAGASKCGKIKIQQWYSHWDDNNDVNKSCTLNTSKWFDADVTVQCGDATFGDPAKGKGKRCGGPCHHITKKQNDSYLLNCRSLPCTIQGTNGRFLRVTADRKFEASYDGNSWWDAGAGKSGSDLVRWD